MSGFRGSSGRRLVELRATMKGVWVFRMKRTGILYTNWGIYFVNRDNGTGSVGLGLQSLDGKELFKGKTFVQDPECDSRDLMGGKVGSHKVMEDPIAV